MSTGIPPLEDQARQILDEFQSDPEIDLSEDYDVEDLLPLLEEGEPLSVNMKRAGEQLFGWNP